MHPEQLEYFRNVLAPGLLQHHPQSIVGTYLTHPSLTVMVIGSIILAVIVSAVTSFARN